MVYDFDKLIDRHGTNCGKWEFMPVQNPNAGLSTLPFWVADMDFPCPDGVIEALHERVDRRIFGTAPISPASSSAASAAGSSTASAGMWTQRMCSYCNGIVPPSAISSRS